jgi:hypothetical protein
LDQVVFARAFEEGASALQAYQPQVSQSSAGNDRQAYPFFTTHQCAAGHNIEVRHTLLGWP